MVKFADIRLVLGHMTVCVHLAIIFIILVGTSVTKVILSSINSLIAFPVAFRSTNMILGFIWFTLLLIIYR